MSAANDPAGRASQLSTIDNNGTESIMSLIAGPKIRISNEPELRLRIKELDEDVDEWRFLAYAEEDKGLFESSSQASSYCNSAYLEAIKHNLAIVNMACLLEIDADYELIEDVIMATKEELSRLQRHPELFPNKDIKEKFWRSVQYAGDLSVKYVIPKQEARDHAHAMLRMEFEEDMRTPGKDMQRKPWEDFLHNRAPGTEADLSMFAEEGSVQIVPMAASRILMSYLDEHKAIIRDIEAQREDLKPYAPSSGNNLPSNGFKRSPYGNLRSHMASTDLLKPTVAGPLDVARREDMMSSLETLNLDFTALDGRRPPLRPRMWNCVSLAIHESPRYDVDSTQRNETAEEMMSLIS